MQVRAAFTPGRVALAVVVLVSAGAAVGAQAPPPFEVLLSFDNPPLTPIDGLVEGPAGLLYGVTIGGGSRHHGAVFGFQPAPGAPLQKLYSLPDTVTDQGVSYPSTKLLSGPTLATDGRLYGLQGFQENFSESTAIYAVDPASGERTLLRRLNRTTEGTGAVGPMIEVGDELFGVLLFGGVNGGGVVFRYRPADDSFAVLHSFLEAVDGRYPQGGLVFNPGDGYLYGTTYIGGSAARGTLYRILPAGGPLQVLHHFQPAVDGSGSFGELAVGPDGKIYGTTTNEGPASCGTLYRVDPALAALDPSTPLEILHAFACDATPSRPQGGLVVTPAAIFGISWAPPSQVPCGVYRLDPTAGLGPELLHAFPARVRCQGRLLAASDGFLYGQTGARVPSSALAPSDGPDQGEIFRIDPGSGAVTTLQRLGTEPPGRRPQALVQTSDGRFFGTLRAGGSENRGVIFEASQGGGFAVRHIFDEGALSRSTVATLAEGSDGWLWGTQSDSGPARGGSVFRFDPDGGGFGVVKYMTHHLETRPYAPLVEDRLLPGTFYGTSNGSFDFPAAPYRVDATGAGGPLFDPQQQRLFSFVPVGKLWQEGQDLYGVYKLWGGQFFVYLSGGVFRIDANGSVAVLKQFSFGEAWEPTAGLTPSPFDPGGPRLFYGTSKRGGSQNRGAIYAITPAGGYRTVHSFAGGAAGEAPLTELVPGPGGLLYGETSTGGAGGFGTVFALVPGQPAEQVVRLHDFDYTGGASPDTALVAGADGALYGVTPVGGPGGGGVLFRINLAPVASGGGPYAVDEGSAAALTLTASGADPRGGALAFAWDLDGDGTYETPGASASFTPSALDGPATEAVSVQATNDLGISATASASVSVLNLPPAAVLTATPGSVVAGACFELRFSDAHDPSAADEAAGFHYAFDCDGDGAFEAGGASPTRLCHTSAAGTVAAAGRISDKDGGASAKSVSVNVLSPEEAIEEQLVDVIQGLIDAGVLGGGQGNALLSKLDAVIAALQSGNPQTAANVLGAFINSVEAAVRSGRLPPDVGEALIDVARLLVSILVGGGGGGSCPA